MRLWWRQSGSTASRCPSSCDRNPQQEGRYQIAYGHRRLRAAIELGRPVRAIVKPLTDEQLVVAQGQENSARNRSVLH